MIFFRLPYPLWFAEGTYFYPWLLLNRNSLTILILSCLGGCHSSEEPQTVKNPYPAPSYLDIQKLAEVLIERADVQAGEHIMFVAEPNRFYNIIPALVNEINKRNATYLGTFSVSEESPQEWSTDFIEDAPLDSTKFDELVSYFNKVDLGIMLPGATPDDLAYAAMQEVLNQGKGRTIHFHWAGAYDLEGQLLENTRFIDSIYQYAIFKTDYEVLAARQEALEDAMRDAEILVTTEAGTAIRFEIGNRPVTRQDGDASAARATQALNLIDREVEIPAGAIRVAPIEESVNGRVVFPLSYWNNTRVDTLTLTFEKGQVVQMEAVQGQEAVLAEMEEAGYAGESFREFALGINPLLSIIHQPESIIPYYGYGNGVVRLSLGDNTELGGKVGGGYVRWNFFPDATVEIGGEIWVEKGKLIK